MVLAAYNKKRHFDVTPEPSGEVETRRRTQLTFVIQKHDATRLHYDFRLEMDGVLKSWAVPKGPSTSKGEKRLAVEVEDHPLAYGKFEGTIPQGNYGGGTVMLWDRGTYEPKSDPLAALKVGKIEFTLHGEKLQGDWTLLRMRPREGASKVHWLLLKSGENATAVSAKDDDRSVESGRGMEEIGGPKPRKAPTKKPKKVARKKAAP